MRTSLLVFCLPFLCAAETASQTTWDAGPDPYGGVTWYWSSSFLSSSGISWYYPAGEIGLDGQCPLHEVSGEAWDAEQACQGDLDGDGDVDVIAISQPDYGTGWLRWWENTDGQGLSWTMHSVCESVIEGQCTAPLDVDGDGDLDILSTSYNTGSDTDVFWWENTDGAGAVWEMHVVSQSFDGAYCVSGGDVDGDGDSDLVAASPWEDTVGWWENADGAGGTWVYFTVDASCPGAIHAQFDDMDGDGDQDILGAGYSAGDVVWWENLDGQGMSWEKHVCSDGTDSVNDACMADFDGDGDIDYCLACWYADGLSWWENSDGAGTSWEEHEVAVGPGPVMSICPGDFDGDGDPDVAGTSGTWTGWWENTGASGSWVLHSVDECVQYALCVEPIDIGGVAVPCLLAPVFGTDQIVWWDLSSDPEYLQSPADLTSLILYLPVDPDWQEIYWTSATQPGTSVGFQVRASDNASQMGAWSDTLWTPCNLQGILPDYCNYLQYKAILTTTDPSVAPVLYEVDITYNSLGTGEGGAHCGVELLPVTPNPGPGAVTVVFGVAEPCEAILSVFDLSGRLVRRTCSPDCQPGWHQVRIDVPGPGEYLARLEAGGAAPSRRFTVLD